MFLCSSCQKTCTEILCLFYSNNSLLPDSLEKLWQGYIMKYFLHYYSLSSSGSSSAKTHKKLTLDCKNTIEQPCCNWNKTKGNALENCSPCLHFFYCLKSFQEWVLKIGSKTWHFLLFLPRSSWSIRSALNSVSYSSWISCAVLNCYFCIKYWMKKHAFRISWIIVWVDIN